MEALAGHSASPPILQDTVSASQHDSRLSWELLPVTSCGVSAAYPAEPSAALGAGQCPPACSGVANCGMKGQDHWQQQGASAGGLCWKGGCWSQAGS